MLWIWSQCNFRPLLIQRSCCKKRDCNKRRIYAAHKNRFKHNTQHSHKVPIKIIIITESKPVERIKVSIKANKSQMWSSLYTYAVIEKFSKPYTPWSRDCVDIESLFTVWTIGYWNKLSIAKFCSCRDYCITRSNGNFMNEQYGRCVAIVLVNVMRKI